MGRITLEQIQTGERFIKIPMAFVESKYYSKFSTEGKYLYGILYNRFQLSVKNGWVDDKNCVYLIYTVEDLCKILGFGKNKVIKLKKELVKYGLLEEVRQGLNKPNLLYLQNVETKEGLLNSDFEEVKNSPKPAETAEVSNSNFQTSQNQTSGSLKNKLQEVSNSNSNKIDSNKTDSILSEDEEERISDKNPEKIEKATKYDKDYIYELVQARFLDKGYSQGTVDYLVMQTFDQRYRYALEHMRFARSSEAVADYVFNGLNSDLQMSLRKLATERKEQ
ncbi:replication initiator protein A [Streptococcus mutans]|uniref:replication initiator protein A n=1 Tax=Streptococcus mutans TaxID=1309 RepID=UPI0028EC1779|nr:replication initiator protein A [Streptococcus mutans]MDT9554900.1 replication initiator protein A [Streptococcus mutans]MDT9574546.1 replication initiator protein A [Streptococcus mutans]MDT9578103.1 replication initiator protein A [Streptococcus mutans]